MIPGWLLYGDLPPTGNRIVLARDEGFPPQFSGYTPHWVQSGTAALALALMTARRRNPDVQTPTVILPAYGCPDLIAAAEFAGLQPLLVDIGVDDPGYDLEQLAQALDDATVAVVAVNFLGIRERLVEIRALLSARPRVSLVEDDAQWFPEPVDGSALAGDLVCLSFGRGKPVSLLGGGALLVREDFVGERPAAMAHPEETGFSLRTKAMLFNMLLQPRLYGLVNRNPLLELGQTKFKPLRGIRKLDTQRVQALSAAIEFYIDISRDSEREWLQALANWSELQELAVAPTRRGRLLRYPVLCRDMHDRDRLWSSLDRAGLGVTAMYRCALPEVDGVAGKFSVFRDYANARRFAARLLTLPVHERVCSGEIARAMAVLAQNALRRE